MKSEPLCTMFVIYFCIPTYRYRNAQMTVMDLKGEILMELDVPTPQQRLLLKGRVLTPDDCLLSTKGPPIPPVSPLPQLSPPLCRRAHQPMVPLPGRPADLHMAQVSRTGP